MFNNHKHCNSQWCLILSAQAEGKHYARLSGWLSHEVPEEEKIYIQLKKIVDLYGVDFYLRQSMYIFNTQTNEALNQSRAMVTPNIKVFHESQSFHYRHAIVIVSHNWGAWKFFE